MLTQGNSAKQQPAGKMGVNKLASRLIQWFDISSGKDSTSLSYRFTGLESKKCLVHIPALILQFINECTSPSKRILLQIHLSVNELRKLISFTTRFTLTVEDLNYMKDSATNLYKMSCIYFATIDNSMWILTQCAPVHAEQTISMYNLGLAVNSMEPREQKHQAIAKYAENTTCHKNAKWNMIFRHEFIALIYLRERGADLQKYATRGYKYLPKHDTDHCSTCGLALTDSKTCPLCELPMIQELIDMIN